MLYLYVHFDIICRGAYLHSGEPHVPLVQALHYITHGLSLISFKEQMYEVN